MRTLLRWTHVVLRFLVGAALVGFIGWIYIEGPRAYQESVAEEQHFVSLEVPAEPLSVTILSVGTVIKPHYRQGPELHWTTLNTDSWTILNGRTMGYLCREVLEPFMIANTSPTEIAPDKMDDLALIYRGRPLELYAHIPRFHRKPPGIENCTGIGYDAPRGLLTLLGQPVAVLADYQPILKSKFPASSSH